MVPGDRDTRVGFGQVVAYGLGDIFGGGSFGVMGLLFGALYALVWIPVFLGIRETAAPQQDKKPEGLLPTLSALLDLWKNRRFRIHMGLYIAGYSAMDILMAAFIYFLYYVIGRPELFSLAMGSLLLSPVIVMAGWVYLGNRIGKRRVLVFGARVMALGLILAGLLLDAGSPDLLVVVLCALMGIGLSAVVYVPWAALPSVTDVGALIDGKRRAGIYAVAMTFVRKIVQRLIALPLVGVALGLLGFRGGGQTDGVDLMGFRIFFIVLPTLLLTVAAYQGLRFPINPRTHALLRKILNRRGERVNTASASQEGIEEITAVGLRLTGLPPEKWACPVVDKKENP